MMWTQEVVKLQDEQTFSFQSSPRTDEQRPAAAFVKQLFFHHPHLLIFITCQCFSLSLSLQPDDNKHILALQFSWKNGIKPKGSIFVGVSPEFEFALYTLCFLVSPNERVKVQFSLYDVEIVCHHYNQKHIGTTYPVLLKYRTPQQPDQKNT